MQQNRHQPRFSLSRFLVAVLVLCAVVLMGFAAVSPQTHACLHEHHDAADHDCVIKQFSDGKCLTTGPVSGAPLIAWVIQPVAATPVTVFLPPVPYLLPAGRAPPTA
ncbi:MAG: hypothetical protein EBS05_07145 [Proteobacteria bacterium]|nr:hypothetical protein [Pseudomonadota bacterium]